MVASKYKLRILNLESHPQERAPNHRRQTLPNVTFHTRDELKGNSYPQVLTLNKLALTTNTARIKTSCLDTTAGGNILVDQPCPQKICLGAF